MLNFIKKLFGAKPATTEAPYKVEAPKLSEEAKAPKAKKPTVKKATTRKPKAAKAPKA